MTKSRSYPDMYLSDESHLAALGRMRLRISKGEKLKCVDSETLGNKYTESSWGMCTEDPEFWPKEDRMWPDREPTVTSFSYDADGRRVDHARVSSKYHDKGQFCPFDRRPSDEAPPGTQNEPWGCFHRCRIFSPRGDSPSRETALKLYDVAIDEFRGKLGRT